MAVFLLFGGKPRWTEEEYPPPNPGGRGGGGEPPNSGVYSIGVYTSLLPTITSRGVIL